MGIPYSIKQQGPAGVVQDEQMKKLSDDNQLLRSVNKSLQESVWQLEKKLEKIEDSKLGKIMLLWNKTKSVMSSSSYIPHHHPSISHKASFIFSRRGFQLSKKVIKMILKLILPSRFLSDPCSDHYSEYKKANFARSSDLKIYKLHIETCAYQPLMSIILPVYDPPVDFFRQTLDSVLKQVYHNWELCIADDCSKNPEIREIIKTYAERDARIKYVFRETNGHISEASNSAMEISKGEFSVLLDHDDVLAPDALYHILLQLNLDRSIDLIYTDEDKINELNEHREPHFKPEWSPDNLLSRNYFGHLVVLRTSILKEIGGFRKGFEGSQDYDLLLRFTERTNKIAHVPRVLYHWRIHEESAAASETAKPYAYHAAKRALEEALERRNEPGKVDFLPGLRGYSVRFELNKPGKISIIIPTKDKAPVLEKCLESIYMKSTYRNFEILVVDNNSEHEETYTLLDKYAAQYPESFRYISCPIEFNFSKLMNEGVAETKSDYLLFLNNDTEVISPDWLEGMMEQAQRPHIGMVGVKLLYHNDTIQHAGVIIGLGGAAGHTFVGSHRYGPGYFNYVNCINNYSALTGACFMCRREIYDEVNGFDEGFQVEYNDIDLCLKMVDKGYHNIYLPHVELYHYESLTRGNPFLSKSSTARHVRELGLFKSRWKKYIDADPCYNPNLNKGVHDFGFVVE